MLLTENGLSLQAFDTTMASLLGNNPGEIGANLLVEAYIHQHKRVELWDWFYLLLKAPAKTAVRQKFIESLGMDVERFIAYLEAAFDLLEECKGPPPADLLPTTVSPDVLQMLDRAEALAKDHLCLNVSELELSLAIISCAGEDMTEFLADVLGREEDGLGRFKKTLLARIRARSLEAGDKIPDLFESVAPHKIRQEVFSIDGLRFCKRWRADMAALGIRTKVTTRHLLYSILGNSSGSLASALSIFGVAVQDMHAALTHEMSHPRRKRNDVFQLTRDGLFDSVVAVLLEAAKLSWARGAIRISEADIHRAFLARQEHELLRLLPKHGMVNLAAVSDFLEEEQAVEEELPPQRHTIPEIQDRVNAKIFGQQLAVARIMPWIKRLRFGFLREGRPAAVFLFLGVIGTGKTQLAKELARYVYGNEDEMLFFEMGMFNTKESINNFIGSPPGYIGYGEGKLTNGLRDHPECVVLFDEIEKADITVFDALLRFADEGKISDPAGPVRDGRRCIIVMTSNAGQRWLRDYVKEHPEVRDNPDMLSEQLFEAAMKELANKGFRPESLLGRVDEHITFVPFSRATCRQIVDDVLNKDLSKFEEKEVIITIPDEVRDILSKFTFDTAMDQGARGAHRAVNRYIISPAIDLLAPISERGEPLPPRLTAVALGKDGVSADGEYGISLEVESWTTSAAPDRPLPLSPGTRLADRFEIVEFLGAGSFGEVYRARQLLFGHSFRNVALKLFREGVVTAENIRNFLNDAFVVFELLDENPTMEIGSHLVQVYDMGIVETPVPRAFMSMRLIPGKKTLKSEVQRFRHAGGMPVALSLRYMRELLLPLAWMHGLETPAVHGDLKPENVMLTDDSRLVLVDFGLAARMPLGVRGGTIAYDAPEKLQGLLGGPAADVFSVGVIWYELLTGQHPFKNVGMEALGRGDTEAYIQEHIAARKWPICAKDKLPVDLWQRRIAPASEINKELAEQYPQIELLLNRCLAQDISERFPNACVLLDSISAYIEIGGIHAKSDLEVIDIRQQAKVTDPSVEAMPRTNDMRLDDAIALISQDKPDKALEIVDQILLAAPQSVPALQTKCKALVKMKRFTDADDACGKAMGLAPQDPTVYETLAMMREAQGKPTQAAGYRNIAASLRSQQLGGTTDLYIDEFQMREALELGSASRVNLLAVRKPSAETRHMTPLRHRMDSGAAHSRPSCSWISAESLDRSGPRSGISRFQFSAFYPEKVAARETSKIMAWVHTEELANDVARKTVGRFDLPPGTKIRAGSVSKAVPRQSVIKVTPDVPGLAFDILEATLSLWEDAQSVEFRFQPSASSTGQVCKGWIHFWLEGIALADVSVSIFVAEEEVPDIFRETLAKANARPYRAVFPSYSHADHEIVERMEIYAAAFGDEYIRDVHALRAGQKWKEELLRFIKRADVFQLFWSASAAGSTYVAREWQHALLERTRRPDPYFMRPVYWTPAPFSIPKPLQELHFVKVPL